MRAKPAWMSRTASSARSRPPIEAIGERPGTGSPRHGRELEMSGLRSRPVARFPFLIFYREHEDRVEVLRVIQAQRNIPAVLRGKDS